MITYHLIISIIFAALYLYGFINIVNKNTSIYCKNFVYALGCLLFGNIFDILYTIIPVVKSSIFTVSLCSTFACFLFFVSSNYCIMDKIIDDGSKKYKKYRKISLIAPMFFILLIFALKKYFDIGNFVPIIFIIPIIPASYFSFKLLIIPVKKKIFACEFKTLHTFSLILYFSYIVALASYLDASRQNIFFIISNVFMIISWSMIVYTLKRGGEKWSAKI